MAKKNTHPTQMHVPAKIGFTILAIAVMVYALFLAAMYVQNSQVQTTQTSAARCYWNGSHLVCPPPPPTAKPVH
jgi:hypothetical protein